MPWVKIDYQVVQTILYRNLYLKVGPRIINIPKNPTKRRMQVTKEEKEDDLAPDKEDKLTKGGEEARGERAGCAAQKRHHLGRGYK